MVFPSVLSDQITDGQLEVCQFTLGINMRMCDHFCQISLFILYASKHGHHFTDRKKCLHVQCLHNLKDGLDN